MRKLLKNITPCSNLSPEELEELARSSLEERRENFLQTQANEAARRRAQRPTAPIRRGYASGSGNFGETTARAKRFITPKSVLHDATDPLQAMFWNQHIHVDVCCIRCNVATGRDELVVIGSNEDVAAARQLCLTLDPPIDVICKKPKRK